MNGEINMDMNNKPKKRYKDYKHVVTMKTLDTSFYREGLPYLVKFNGDEKGKDIDFGIGAVGICTSASGGGLTFVFARGTFVHEKCKTNIVSLTCPYLDNSKIEIIPYYSDEEVLKLIDAVRHNPEGFHGYKYWNEEIEIFDQELVEKSTLNKNFSITVDGETRPLLFEDGEKDGETVYRFNMGMLQTIEEKNALCTFHLKRSHTKDWQSYSDFKLRLLHNPDGFQLFHTLETDEENQIKDTWYPVDILSQIKGMKIEATSQIEEAVEEVDIEEVEVEDNDTNLMPDINNFFIRDTTQILGPFDEGEYYKDYPLFVEDPNYPTWIINTKLLDAIDKRNIIFEITIGAGGYTTSTIICKGTDMKIHIGGTVLTGKRYLKVNDQEPVATVDIKANEWDSLRIVHVRLKKVGR